MFVRRIVMSRKQFAPTPKQRNTVSIAKAAGLTHQQISDLIGIDEKTLVKHFEQELREAHQKAITAVASNLYRRATSQEKEAVPAAIFWLKTRGGWREPRHDDGQMDERLLELVEKLVKGLPG